MKNTILLFTIGLALLSTPCKSQEPSCRFNFEGRIVGENDRPLKPNPKVQVKYKFLSNEPILTDEVATDMEGHFDVCIAIPQNREKDFQNIPNLYEIDLEIEIYGYYTYKINQFHLKEYYDFGDLQMRKQEELENPTPVDIVTQRDLLQSGQTTVGRALHLLSPAFNSTCQPVSDGGAHFDPTDFKLQGASHCLLLLNGIRKNFSAYMQSNDVPTKGEVGVDIRSIPMAAIRQVRIERQEATTIYGSDAIGGVIDFQLKERDANLSISPFSGVNNDKWDAFTFGVDVNKGIDMGSKGFLMLTYSYLNQSESNRANSPGYDSLYKDITPTRNNWIAQYPTLKMQVGEPNIVQNSFFYNAKAALKDETLNEVYSFGGISYRYTSSYANYRAPYWIKNDYRLFSLSDSTYTGFQPSFESDVRDHFVVLGLKGGSQNGALEYDLNQTIAGNNIDFAVDSSFNASLKANSPITFEVGGYNLSNNNTKANFLLTVNDAIQLGFGGDFRSESYTISAGEEKSYLGEGTISYPGTRPQDALTANRNNFGAYGQFLIKKWRFNFDLSGRYEKYVKYEPETPFKVALLFRVVEAERLKWALRASYSKGFRAPALQQLYYNRVQTVTSATSVANRGTFSTNSPVLRQLGVEKLKNEKSATFSIGTALNFEVVEDLSRLSFNMDYYRIGLENRIVLSSNLDSADIPDATNPVRQVLSQNNVRSMNFFLNGVDTRSSGIDFNISYTHLFGRQNQNELEFSCFSNRILENRIEKIADAPGKIATAMVSVFNRKEQARLLYSRPNQKTILSAAYHNGKMFDLNLNAINFGKVIWQHQNDPSKDQTFGAKWIFNLGTGCFFTKGIYFSFFVNNILNTYPDELDPKGDYTTNLGGRFKYYRELNQFGYQGRSFLVRMKFVL